MTTKWAADSEVYHFIIKAFFGTIGETLMGSEE